jgi:UDP-galactopyranose mutase
VDAAHFRHGRRGQPVPADYAGTGEPRLGFYGVIDERVDLPLLAGVALAHPEWELFLVGPLRNLVPADIPNLRNLHWLGERPYAELPSHLAAWDACLIPYVVNGTTRFISPTKTLEYMAAEHPIVTTPIRDVVGPYEDIVHVGEGADGFARACGHALGENGVARMSRLERMRRIVDHTSWNHAVKRIEEQLGHVESRFSNYGKTLELTLGSLLRTRDA